MKRIILDWKTYQDELIDAEIQGVIEGNNECTEKVLKFIKTPFISESDIWEEEDFENVQLKELINEIKKLKENSRI